MEINTLIFQTSPEPFDENIVHPSSSSIHGNADLGVIEDIGEICGCELASLVCNEVSIVFESRQARTLRVAQSIMAIRYKNPRRMGM